MQDHKALGEVEVTQLPKPNDVIIDIRHPSEEEESPLVLTNNQIVKIPFYELAKKFKDLPTEVDCLLYCDRGVMSKMQAIQLIEDGFTNVKVYQQ